MLTRMALTSALVLIVLHGLLFWIHRFKSSFVQLIYILSGSLVLSCGLDEVLNYYPLDNEIEALLLALKLCIFIYIPFAFFLYPAMKLRLRTLILNAVIFLALTSVALVSLYLQRLYR